MPALKVFGHLTPDTDATCAAVVYAWYLTTYKDTEAVAYMLGTPNKETAYVLQRFGHTTPELLKELNSDDVVVIVDTNNPEELPADIKSVTIQEIVDHHKMGGVMTAAPVNVTLRPVACTCTVIWQIMSQENHTNVREDIAGLMLASILSDTLNFTSPTVTQADKDAAEALALLAKVNPDELANAMFEAKSDLSGLSARDILLSDGKMYTMGDKKVLMATLETTKPGNVLALRDELIVEMEKVKQEQNLAGAFFFVVDILTTSAQLIFPSSFERVAAEKGFGKTAVGDILELPGVVSRKKQMVPAIEKGVAL